MRRCDRCAIARGWVELLRPICLRDSLGYFAGWKLVSNRARCQNLVRLLFGEVSVVKLTRDYIAQRKAGIEPRFHGRDYPELGDQIDHTIWTRD